jgi:O-antigen/teichoic acid export membrane protein
VIGAMRRRVGRLARGQSAPYVAAVAIRTAARAVWGIAVPAALSLDAYGRYQLIATTAAMAAQVALLGTPQTIVRYAGRRIPTRLVALHAVALAAGAIAIGAAAVSALRTPDAAAILTILVAATMAVAVLGARAKAAFAFTTSCVAEAAGALVLLAAIFMASPAMAAVRDTITPTRALGLEAVALMATAGVLLRRRQPLPSAPNESIAPPARAVFANIYAVGVLALLDVVLFRRLEVYFLERSPDGLTGVAVLGLALQIATVALLVPTALLEAWQPRFATLASGNAAALEREVKRRQGRFVRLMAAIVLGGALVPVVAIPLVFPQYRPWLAAIVGFVVVRLACAGAGFYSSVLYATGGQRALYAPALASALVAVGANAVLTPRLGLRGALVAYGLTQVTLAVLTILAFHRGKSGRRVAEPLAAAA